MKMKKVCFILFLASLPCFGQLPTTTCRNIFESRGDRDIIFSVYLKNTSAVNIEYSGGQFHFSFNKAILGSGTGTFKVLSSGLGSLAPKNPSVVTTTSPGQLRTTQAPFPGAGNGFILAPGDSLKVATFQLSCSILLAAVPADIIIRRNIHGNPFCKFGAYINMVNTEIQNACTFIDMPTWNPYKVINLISPNGGENWHVGETDTVRWSSQGVEVVKMYYKTNAGNDWVLINYFALTSPPFFAWVIPNTPSTSCRVMIKDFYSECWDSSALPFTISLPPDSVQITSPIGGETFTSGDTCFIQWVSPLVNSVRIEYTTDAGAPWLLIADSVSTPLRKFEWLVPNTPSNRCRIKISKVGGPSTSVCSGLFSIAPTCVDVPVAEGWNLVSVPLCAASMNRTVLFPGANSFCFGFNNSYQTVEQLENGKGYWLRFPAPANSSICGSRPDSSIHLNPGWNIIGVYAFNSPVLGVTTTPPDILASNFYKYNNGYQTVSVLESGKGYWVRASQAGVLNLPQGVFAKQLIPEVKSVEDTAAHITITDNLNRKATLYLSESAEGITEAAEMPPPPPRGVFDVRFSNDRIRETLDRNRFINIQGADYPITIAASGLQIRVRDAATQGKLLNAVIEPGREIAIGNSSVESIEIMKADRVYSLELMRNYPNPFNPSTVISFQLPEQQHVELKVFDVLGNEVALLASGMMPGGYHEARFHANALSSGVYIYRLKVGNTILSSKMVLMR